MIDGAGQTRPNNSKRNANVVAALIGNFDTAEAVLETSANSAGSALAENEKRLDSIQGKLTLLQASVEGFAEEVFDTEALKDILDLVTSLVDGLTTIVDLVNKIPMAGGPLPLLGSSALAATSVVGSISGNQFGFFDGGKINARYSQNLNEAQRAVAEYQKMIADIDEGTLAILKDYADFEDVLHVDSLSARVDSLSDGMGGLNENVKNYLKTLNGSKASFMGYMSYTVKTKGVVETLGLAMQATGLKTALLNTAMNAAAGLAFSIGLQIAITAISALIHAEENAIQKTEDLLSTFDSSQSTFTDNLKTIEDASDEFKRLANGVAETGENIHLTSEEYTRYYEIVDSIVALTPELVSGYNAEGKAIVDKNKLIEESIRLLKEERKYEALANTDHDDKTTLINGVVAGMNTDSRDNATILNDTGLSYVDAANIISGVVGKPFSSGANHRGTSSSAYTPEAIGRYMYEYADVIRANMDEIKNAAKLKLDADDYEAFESYLAGMLESTDRYEAQIKKYCSEVLDGTEYLFLDESLQGVVQKYMDTLDYAGVNTYEELTAMQQGIRSFVRSLADESGQLNDTVEFGIRLVEGVDENGDPITFEEYQNGWARFVNDVKKYGGENADNILAAFGANPESPERINGRVQEALKKAKSLLKYSEKDLADTLTMDELMLVFSIDESQRGMTIEELREKLYAAAKDAEYLRNAISEINNVQTKMKKISDALGDFSENGIVTADVFSEMKETFGELDSWENFVTVLGNSNSTMAEAQAAANKLGEELVDECGVLNSVTEETAELTIAELKSIGVKNARELVERQLKGELMESRVAVMGLTDATWDEVEAALSASGATNEEIASLQQLRSIQYNAELASINFANAEIAVAEALMQTAVGAGASAKSMLALHNIMDLMTRKANGSITAASDSAWYHGRTTRFEGLTQYEADHYDELINYYKEMAKIDLSDVEIDLPKVTVKKTGMTGMKNAPDEYIADIDRFREAIERLESVQKKHATLDLELEGAEAAEDLEEQISIYEKLISVYKEEQQAMHALNNERDEAIIESIANLEKLGFVIQYNRDTNEFLVENLEHINELQATSKGEYDSLQEATNEYRKEIEKLVEDLESWNEANTENSESWWDLYHKINESKIKIIDALKEIVTKASEAVDTIQGVYDTLHQAADEYAESGGFISIDTFQEIIDLGPQYVQYLMDENGLLTINEEKIKDVISARIDQLAVENALIYVERLRYAMQEGSVEKLDELLYATTETTDATWGLVYATLSLLGLEEDQYNAAKHNIDAIYNLAEATKSGVGSSVDTYMNDLEKMEEGMGSILEYVMDMIKQRTEKQIEELEKQVDEQEKLIEQKKEMLDMTKKEADYEEEVADKVKEIAKLQAEIDKLSLDGSRDSTAKRAELAEEMAKLQKELDKTQSEHAIDMQKESLDDMQEVYEEQKEDEIKTLEDSISSEEKLYQLAIKHIKDNWDTLYDELLTWNAEYGTVINQEITEAWEEAAKAVDKYGSAVAALSHENGIYADIKKVEDAKTNYTVGNSGNSVTVTDRDKVNAYIGLMKKNAVAWHSADSATKRDLEKANEDYAKSIEDLIHQKVEKKSGTWYVGGEELFLKKYHSGGIAGGGSLKENELMSVLEDGEPIISNRNRAAFFSMLEFTSHLSKKLDMLGGSFAERIAKLDVGTAHGINNISNSTDRSVRFGDVYIYGANEETVRKHREINREFANEVLKQLNIKK